MMLSELSQIGVGLARDLRARAQVTSDPATVCKLASAYAQVTYEVRQAIELEARLRREAPAGPAPQPQQAPVAVAGPPKRFDA